MQERIKVLTVAGHDPSSGAGITSDIKVFEKHNVYGLSVLTATTNQVEDYFDTVNWLKTDKILDSIKLLMKRYELNFVKIGLLESFSVLRQIIRTIRTLNPAAFIIWDPILKSSTGFKFHDKPDEDNLKELLISLDLITPNYPEAKILTGIENAEEAAKSLSENVNVLLKGGHRTDRAIDILYQENSVHKYESDLLENAGKHGSGCVLASAILANLALGNPLKDACDNAKTYVQSFLKSSKSKLGYHENI